MTNIKKDKNKIDYPHYKCKVCGLGDIDYDHDICLYYGWEDDDIQQSNSDYAGGANHMSLNQHKKFWEENQDEILANIKNNRFYAIEKSQEYFKNLKTNN